MSYIKEDFLLNTPEAERLYYDYAADMPIFDYHCHLSEYEIFEDREFDNIYEMWLKYDHYKWRLMRNYGIDEKYVTGGASDYDKFVAYCRALGTAFGNPLYHWSQMELKNYFDCDVLINEENADYLWCYCNDYIRQNHLKPSDLIRRSNVKYLFTTNEVYDNLSVFEKINSRFSDFSVFPAFRADKMLNIDADAYLDYLSKLEGQTFPISTLNDLERALKVRLDCFLEVGCTAADMALERVPTVFSREKAQAAFDKKLRGMALDIRDADAFKGYLAKYLMGLYADKKIVSEVHVGARRNNNSKAFHTLGADSGFDSISEACSTEALSRLFDALNDEGRLPKTILFNLNPKMNMELIALMGCFQDGSAKGKIQYGAAWWFLDHKEGMFKNLRDLTSAAHLDAFLGMLTDSRSFLSYARHHYFRRILCDYLGELMSKSEIVNDFDAVGSVVQNVCYTNAVKYFNME